MSKIRFVGLDVHAWVDFAAIKQSVPLAPLWRRYQVKLRRSGPDQYRGCCPIHGGQGPDAFHANLTRNVFVLLLGCHLTRSCRAFSFPAHYHGFCPQQREVVWNLLP